MSSTTISRTLYNARFSRGRAIVTTFLLVAFALASATQAATTRLRPLRAQEPDAVEAPPVNDFCSGAIAIPGDGPFPHFSTPVNVFEAGTAGDPPRPSEFPFLSLTRSSWYAITPAEDGRYVFSACTDNGSATTLRDSLIAAYTSTNGCSGPFTNVASSLVGCFFSSSGTELSVDLSAGTTYYIVLWSETNHPQNASQADVQMRTTFEPGPPDTCDIAVPLGLNVPTNGTNLNTGNDYELAPGSACFPAPLVPTTGPGSDVVYSFTAPAAGNYAFRLNNRASVFVDYVIYLSSTCPSPSKEGPVVVDCFAASRTGSFSGGEISCVTLAAGQQVFLFVDSPTTTGIFRSGNFSVVVELCEALESEANDTPATADPLGCGVIGSLGPTITDRDFYAFGTPSSDVRLYALVDASTSMPENDFDLRVNTTTHTLEFDHRDNSIGPNGGVAPNVAGTRIPAGTPTFLQVDIRQSQGGGTAVETGGPYRLYAVAQDHADSVAEAEPNDTINQSNSAASNYFTGQLAASDADHFVFQANAGDVLFLSMDGCPDRGPTGIFAEMQLLSETGSRIALTRSGSDQVFVFPPLNSLFAFGPNWRSAAMVVRAPYTGFYVARLSNLQNTPQGPYAISISKNCDVGGGGVPACTLTCPGGTVTATTDPGQCTAVVNLPVPATDGFCGVVSCSPPSGSAFPVGTTVVDCTGAGVASCQFTVNVTDDEPPAVTCPSSVAAAITGATCDVAVSYNVTASDNCAVSGVTCSPPSGSSFGPGTTVVTCNATDAAGNTATCAFPVVVTDASAPTLSCPADITVSASQAQGCSIGAPVTFATPPVSDNCTGATVVCVPTSGTFFPVGTTTVTCTASDAAGNTAACAFSVTVGTPGSICFRDDASGDTFTEVVDSASPLFGFWRYRKANGTTFCGFAENVSFTSGVRLVSSDRNDSVFRMECNANFGSTTSTVQVTELATGRRHTLRDRNVNNNPPCP
ncbi:MAG: HYR domain-containing protein [Blastocatellia bacterium]|nr:HYR domain-containing protein [Blastocatellia bacterium]